MVVAVTVGENETFVEKFAGELYFLWCRYIYF